MNVIQPLRSLYLRLFLVAALCGVVLFASVGCKDDGANGGSGPSGYPYKIVTTVAMIADITRQVAGDKAEVVSLMGEGVDPHIYQPTLSDVQQIDGADVVFYNGLMLEGKMGDTFVKFARDKPVVAVTDQLDVKDYVMEDEEEHHDPHVWMDVAGWMKAVDVIAKTLAEYDPDNAEHYQANAKAYNARLAELHAYAKSAIGSIPEKQRVLVTAHDAFGYFGRAYGLKVMGIQGISTESEAGLRRVESLVDYLVENNISAVFVESSVADKNVRSLVEGAAAKGHTVKIGGELFSDAMGKAGTYEGTYIGMIDHNVTTVTKALGGTAPEGGFRETEKKQP